MIFNPAYAKSVHHENSDITLIWDFLESFHIPLGRFAPQVFGAMIGSTPHQLSKCNISHPSECPNPVVLRIDLPTGHYYGLIKVVNGRIEGATTYVVELGVVKLSEDPDVPEPYSLIWKGESYGSYPSFEHAQYIMWQVITGKRELTKITVAGDDTDPTPN